MNLLQELENGKPPKTVEIERWNIVTALMDLYRSDDDVLDCVRQFKFKGELGCDFGGLSRGILTLL